jgi:putative transferase (TIGR04331 family)
LPTLNPSLHRKKIECPSEFCKDDFQILLFNYLLLDMPSSYLENYSFIDDKLNKLRINPKIIFTANAYWYDDSFNIWSSKRVFYGQSKLYLSQHGGALPPRYVNFNHEGKIADKNITWFKAINQNEIQLPPNKLSFKKINYIKNTKCVIIGYEYSRYSRRIESAAISSQSLTVFNNVCLFIECLNSDFIDSFYYKPYPSQGWGIKSQIQKKFPKLKVVENKLDEILCNSRIVICTYPQTTFSESIALDIPTILLFQDQLFGIIPEASDLVKTLTSSKIIFENPEDAANHIQNIWDDVDSWWQSEQLKETKKLIYQEMILNQGSNWYKSWVNLFNT